MPKYTKADIAKMSYERVQELFCSDSRYNRSTQPGRMGKRLVRNIAEAYPFFLKHQNIKILDIGCGDGFGMQYWREFGFDVQGIEVVQERIKTAQSYGLNAFQGAAEDTSKVVGDEKYNIFCSHTLEHCQDQKKAIDEMIKVTHKLIWIIVPIEISVKGNPAHPSPVRNLEQIKNFFDLNKWEVIKECYRKNIECEGVIVLIRK